MKTLICSIAAVLLAASLCRASEEANDLLKVPPAADRSAGDGAVPETALSDGTTAPDAAPSPDPAVSPAPVPEEEVAEDVVPAPHPVSRYTLLWEKSPFQTESVAPPVQSAGLSERFALAGILREKGEYLIWVRERATQQSHKVDKKTPNALGLSLVEVAENPKMQSEASATIRLGAEIGVIKFDNAGAAAGAPVAAAPFVQQVPNQVPRPFSQPARVATPFPQPPGQVAANIPAPQAAAVANPALPPGVVPPVPGPGIPTEGQVAPGQGQPMPPPRVIRRRAIVPAAP